MDGIFLNRRGTGEFWEDIVKSDYFVKKILAEEIGLGISGQTTTNQTGYVKHQDSGGHYTSGATTVLGEIDNLDKRLYKWTNETDTVTGDKTISGATQNITGNTSVNIKGDRINISGITETDISGKTLTLKETIGVDVDTPAFDLSGTTLNVEEDTSVSVSTPLINVTGTSTNLTGNTISARGAASIKLGAPTVEITGTTTSVNGSTALNINGGTATNISGTTTNIVAPSGLNITADTTIDGNLVVTGGVSLSCPLNICDTLSVNSGATTVTGATHTVNESTSVSVKAPATTVSGSTLGVTETSAVTVTTPTTNISGTTTNITGNTTITGSETVTGDEVVSGNLSVGGDTTLGNSCTDTVNVSGATTFHCNVTAKTVFDALSIASASASSTNVLEEWKLVDKAGHEYGSHIKIYKDSSLKSVELTDTSGGTSTGQFLKFVYIQADGTEKTVYVDASKFLIESEFASGVTATSSGVVTGVVDSSSENFLSVGGNGFKLSGVQTAIDNKVNGLDVTGDTAVGGQYVAAIEETDGLVAVKARANVSEAPLNNYARGSEATPVASGDTLNSAISKLENQIIKAQASATTVVEHTTGNNHVTVSALTASDGHKVYTVNESDIASASGLANEIAARKAVDGQGGQSYVANTGSTYISGATSLNDADVKLNYAIAGVKNIIDGLDVGDVAIEHQFVTSVSQTDGKIFISRKQPFATDISMSGYTVNTGVTESELTISENDTVSASIAKLQQQSLLNEETISKSLNDLNEKIDEKTSLSSYEELTSGSSEKELAINNNDSIVSAFEKIQRQSLLNEITTSRSLNDLNERFTEYVPLSGGTIDGGLTVNGTVTLADDLTVHGNITTNGVSATTGFYQVSDETLKNFAGELECDSVVDKVKNIPTKYFYWKSDRNGERQIGTSAQKVKEIFPEIVSGTDTLTVDYSKLGLLAIAAIKVLSDKVENLEKELFKIKEQQ